MKRNLHGRRDFLRAAIGSGFCSVPFVSPAQSLPVSLTELQGAEAALVVRVTLDRDIYDRGAVLEGQIHFAGPCNGPAQVEWIDAFGRVVARLNIARASTAAGPRRFSFPLSAGLTYLNWIRTRANGVLQIAGASFLLSPARETWEDFHVISWAHYPDGVYDLLRHAGIDGTIASREGQFSNVIDNNFRFYVEQMAPDIFSIYIKNPKLWYNVVNNFSTDRENLTLWVRQPCLNDPKTDQELSERLSRYVRAHKALRPLFYNIADELGQGWQIKPNDFCHSRFCTAKFAEYLRSIYKTPEGVRREWEVGNFTRWDDENQAGAPGNERDLMISYTTTDGAFDAIAIAGLEARYGNIARLNQQWGLHFPEPEGETVPRRKWGPVMDIIREARAVPTVDEVSLEQKLGPLHAANRRWGSNVGKPVGFRTWSEVVSFVNRFYSELAQIRCTEGWNVTPWCDFRNFMDQNFADAVKRAALVCKAEDPGAHCATEGGQSPFPFGWYNYEEVLRAVNVIEPYNGGNNVEIIRSLKPQAIMLNTVGFQYKPGQPLTGRDHLVQKQARRPVWWGLFHRHRGSIVWDNNLPDYQFVNSATREFTPAAEAYSAVFNELRKGIGMLFINSQRLHDGIAIHYSPASDQIHWLLDNLRYARQWMLHSGSDRGSHAIAVRNAWTKLVEDLGLQYEFVSSRQLQRGKLNSGSYRVFIMPQSIALSPREVQQIREFVEDGGLLVADCRTAQMNEHGRDLGRGALDDVFGIDRSRDQRTGQAVHGVANQGSLRLENKLLQVRLADGRVTTTQGRALARSGDVPLVIINQAGKGNAIYLNIEVGDYPYERLQVNAETSLLELVEGILYLAGIQPAIRVLASDGKRLPGTEIVVFKNGPLEHIAIFRNPQFDDGGWEDKPVMKAPGWAGTIDNSYLEKEAEVAIEWTTPQHCYDVRGCRYLGLIRVHKATLSPWEPLVLTRSSQAVPGLGLAITQRVSAGAPVEVTLNSGTAFPRAAFRVVHLEFEIPSGKPYELYARNVLVKSESHTERIPLACNDPKGHWRARVHDVITGVTQELFFEVI